MIRRKKISIWVYVLLFLLIEIVFYYLSGIFVFPDLSIDTFSQHLTDVFTHPFPPWRWANLRTPTLLAVGFIIWIFLVTNIVYYYRNFQRGREFGSADWGNPHDVTKRRKEPKSDCNRRLSWNVEVATEGNRALANNNMLMLGASGSYKTTSIVTTNMLKAYANYIFLDVKGELYYKYGLYLQSKGYTVRSLNMIHMDKSDRYNPFVYLETEVDLIKIVDNIYQALESELNKSSSDPFWTDGPHLYLQSLFYYEWDRSKKDPENPGTINNVMKYLNEEMQIDPERHAPKGAPPITKLQTRMEQLPDEHPALRDYRKFKEGARETVKSIVIIINAKLKLLETKGLQYIFGADDLGLRDFGTGVGGSVEEPTNRRLALFLCVPDNDNQYNFIMSMVYTQAIQILTRMADFDFADRGGKLPIPLEFWMDEFYAGARPRDTEKLMGVIRSRNMSMILILQSKAQLDAVFDTPKKAEILLDNCAAFVFLGAGVAAYETHEYISKLLDNMTIDTESDGKSGKQYNANFNRKERALMTPGEIREMNPKYCIIMLQGEKPIYDRKALPWEMNLPAFQEAMDLNEKSKDKGLVHPTVAMIDAITGDYIPIEDHTEVIKEAFSDEIKDNQALIDTEDEAFLHISLKYDPEKFSDAERLNERILQKKEEVKKMQEKISDLVSVEDVLKILQNAISN